MRIIVAKTAGFCMGVRRAVDLVLDAPEHHPGPICTFGPLIHNPQVLSILDEKGITALDRVPAAGSGTALIRAHGVPPQTKTDLESAGFSVVNATCPRVIRVQTIIQKHAKKGAATIIIGDEDHPEVVGLLGFAGNKNHVVDTLEALAALPIYDQAIIVAQTTQNTRFFQEVIEWVAQNRPDYHVFDTICDSTIRRQVEVAELADAADAVVVVGGRLSGNTVRLAEIAAATGKATFHVETEAELNPADFSEFATVGITAGASTPNWIIRRVCRYLEELPSGALPPWRRHLRKAFQALLLSNIYVALGAGAMTYSCTRLLGAPYPFQHMLLSFLYVLSMHILNNLTSSKADRYNDPTRAAFYDRHKTQLVILALGAGAGGLLTAFFFGPLPFSVLLVMSIAGLTYNLPWLPGHLPKIRFRRLKDLPGSKTILIALAWGVVTVWLPALSNKSAGSLVPWAVFFWSAGMAFGRSTFADLLDIQGDRIVGKETLPIHLGEARTVRVIYGALAMGTLSVPMVAAMDRVPPAGAILALWPAALTFIILAHQKGRLAAGLRLTALVESLCLTAGIAVWLCDACIGF